MPKLGQTCKLQTIEPEPKKAKASKTLYRDLWLALRIYQDSAVGTVWLMTKDGAPQWSVLHGQMTEEKAQALADRLGLELVVERSPWNGD